MAVTKKKKTTELSVNQRKAYAEILYMQGISQKEIALRTTTTEKTICLWVEKGKWDGLRQSMLTSKNSALARLYIVLDKQIKNYEQEENIGDAKLADAISKTTAAIKQLETDASIAEIAESGRLFINYLLDVNKTLAIEVLNEWDEFIKQRLKKG